MDNWFEYESAIIARLKAAVPQLRNVVGLGQPGDVAENAQWTPAAAVLSDGMNVQESPGARSGSRQIVEQRWLAVVVVKIHGEATAARARAEAGGLIMKVIAALSGFAPDGVHELALAPAPPEQYDGDLIMFPVAFSARISI